MNLKAINLVIILIALLTSLKQHQVSSVPSLSTHLVNYDSEASSSSFGEPFFRLEPPNEVIFSNLKGTAIACLASGSPRPTITWYTSSNLGSEYLPISDNLGELSQTRLVTNVTGLRQIVHNGAVLRFLPFKESDYRQDIHSAEYKCVASNQIAIIQSTNIIVQAVMSNNQKQQQNEANERELAKVNDEFLSLDSVAVFKCRWNGAKIVSPQMVSSTGSAASASQLLAAANGLDSFSHLLVEWFTSDGIHILAGQTSKVLKYSNKTPTPTNDNKSPQQTSSTKLTYVREHWLARARISNDHQPSSGDHANDVIDDSDSDSDDDNKSGNKFTAFPSGELHVNNVEPSDLRRTYGCRLRNELGQRFLSSSGLAQLIVTDFSLDNSRSIGSSSATSAQAAKATLAPQVVHTVSQIIVEDSIHKLTASSLASSRLGQTGNQPLDLSANIFDGSGEQDHHHHQSQHAIEEQRLAQLGYRLLMPCAVRGPSPNQLRWFYQPPMSKHLKLVSIEQFALNWNMNLIVNLNNNNQTSNAPAPNNKTKPSSSTKSKLILGPSYLAIEWPRREHSGRYVCQLVTADAIRTMCDINVIIRQPLKLKVEWDNNVERLQQQEQLQQPEWLDYSTSSALTDNLDDRFRGPRAQSLFRQAAGWFGFVADSARNLDRFKSRSKRHQQNLLSSSNALESSIRVRSRGLIPAPPILLVGQHLRLNCLAEGYPIESLRWLRNGQLINTQSSSDFQVEIVTTNLLLQQQQQDKQAENMQTSPERSPIIISTLTIRQLQPKNAGLSMFECLASNSAGDQARASLPVFVAERQLLDWARSMCPIGNQTFFDASNEISEHPNEQIDSGSSFDEYLATFGERSNAQLDNQKRNLFIKQNPFRKALVLESDPFELICPSPPSSSLVGRVDWRRLTTATTQTDQTTTTTSNSNNKLNFFESLSRNFNQLFRVGSGGGGSASGAATAGSGPIVAVNSLNAGDTRFLINGSSLQIRSPSKRHDEAIYFCRHLSPSSPSDNLDRQDMQQSNPSLKATKLTSDIGSSRANSGSEQIDANQLPVGIAVHQSSLASSSTAAAAAAPAAAAPLASSSCWPLLAGGVFGIGASQASSAPQGNAQNSLDTTITTGSASQQVDTMSSISIRIVAKPKIDPFEFSKNLEEGMRAVVVCAVVSGQSPVDITWFKDGNILLEDEKTSIEQANGFSSTLTFHQIRPSHSGLYTCIAANAFASANHTSRLLVNEAAYFIEAPKNTRAILNSNVMVNCRAGGQPSPQIRWRKLVAVNGNAGGGGVGLGGAPLPARQLAPAGGFGKPQEYPMIGEPYDSPSGQQVAQSSLQQQQQKKFEFRIITSNSHIQILENGSMIIKNVELSDASRYVCQAFNGINPSLSEMIELQVLSPAQFDIRYETVSVKRDSMIKFTCAPRGDQPMQIDWFKEGHLLAPQADQERQLARGSSQQQQQQLKYSEIAYILPGNLSSNSESQEPRQRHSNLIVRHNQKGPNNSNFTTDQQTVGMRSSELFINYADRDDTGSFVCFARNPYGRDELTYRLIVQEVPDVPLNVNVQNILSNSLKLSWTAPFDGNLPLSHFVIEYRRVAGPQLIGASEGANQQHSEWVRLVVSSNKLATGSSGLMETGGAISPIVGSQMVMGSQQVYSIVLRQLLARSNYQVRVAAVNGIGQSSFSAHLTVTMAEELPNSRPNDLRAQPISSSSIKLLWRGPAIVDEEAPIKGYYVSHRRLSLEEVSNQEKGRATSGLQQQHQHQQQWISTSSVSVSNSTDFMLMNENGNGADLRQSHLSGVSGGGQLVLGRGSTPTTIGNLNYEFQISNLDKNTKYEFRVQPYNSMGVGPSSETIGQTQKFDRPGQPQLKLLAARKSSLELKWSIQNNHDQPLMGFSLFYKCEYDDWQEIQLGIIYQYVIENLRCGNKYQIYLSAFNIVGRSDPSDVLSARTEGNAPIAPDKSQFYQSNVSEIILDLSSWQSGGCPINSFIIQYKRLHDSNWYILSEGATSFAASEKVSINNLTPASWYKLLVTASNEAGPTNAEYVFSTLDLNGDQIAPTFSMAEHEQHHHRAMHPNSVLSGLHQLLSSSNNSQEGQQDRQTMLASLSCMLLLLITIVCSYLYYSRLGGRSSNTGGSSQSSLASNSNNNNNNNPNKALATLDRKSQNHHSHRALLMDSSQRQQQPVISLSCTGHPEGQQHHQVVDHYIHQSNLAQPQSMIDSFINSAFMGGAGPRASQASTTSTTKLLSSPAANVFLNGTGSSASNCLNSSSMSTHSTQCNFDASSTSAASSTGGAKAKLQLIDEAASMLSELPPIDQSMANQLMENNGQQFQLYESRQVQQQPNESPARNIIYAGFGGDHVNVLSDGSCAQNAESNFSTNVLANQHSTQPDPAANALRQLYGNPANRLLSSTSFASAADLIQRQQQQQEIYLHQIPAQDQQEPIYQRLDKFQLLNYENQASQFSPVNANNNYQMRSQTLRFEPNHSNQTLIEATKTLQRVHQQQLELIQQQQRHLLKQETFCQANSSGHMVQPQFTESCHQVPLPTSAIDEDRAYQDDGDNIQHLNNCQQECS